MWYLRFRGQQKKDKKTKTHPKTKRFPIFNDRNNQIKAVFFPKIEKTGVDAEKFC